MLMTPGTYIRKRREAAELSIDAVAALVSSQPRIAEHDRAAWLRLIEADVVPVGDDVITALLGRFPFDPLLLVLLVDLSHAARVPIPRVCRVCACSDKDPCHIEVGNVLTACSWSAFDLCSACPSSDEPGSAALVPPAQSEAA